MAGIAEDHYLIAPMHVSTGYAVSLSTAQLVGVLLIALLTWTNTRGLQYGRIIQNIFTTAKTGALAGLILLGLLVGWNAAAVHANFGDFWTPRGSRRYRAGTLDAATRIRPVRRVVRVADWLALLGRRVEQHHVHRGRSERPAPEYSAVARPRHRHRDQPLPAGQRGVSGDAPASSIQHAPSDRVATATLDAIVPGLGAVIMAIAIMISTFGCNNGLILAGARAYFAMARDGLFFQRVGAVERCASARVGLVLQGVWAAFLVLPRTYDPATRTYGNLYGNLLDYVISAALIFYILTIAGVFRLRQTRPDARDPTAPFGYPIVPAPLYRRRRHDSHRAVRVSSGDDLPGTRHRPAWSAGLLLLEDGRETRIGPRGKG